MLSRRALVGKLAAGAAVAWTSNIGTAATASARGAAGGLAAASPDSSALGVPSVVPCEAESIAQDSVVEPRVSAEAVVEAAQWDLLHPLASGSPVAHGWHVADLSSVMDGSCVLTLESDRGRSQRVHICRNDGNPQGLVHTEHLDLLVMNGGQGDLPTDEGMAQAIASIAHVLATNEGKRQQRSMVVALMPHSERLQRFADNADARLR